MADLLWDDVRWFFDPEMMGRLPDVTVPGASVDDWQAVLDLVAARGWAFHYSEGEEELPLPRAAAVLSRPADAECPELRVWPSADVLAIFRFYAAEEIDFDVDLREIQGQERGGSTTRYPDPQSPKRTTCQANRQSLTRPHNVGRLALQRQPCKASLPTCLQEHRATAPRPSSRTPH